MQTLSPWLPCSAGLTLQVVLWHSQMGWLPPDPALSLLRVWITTSKPPPQHTYTGYTCKSHRSWSTEGCPGPPPKTLPPAQVQTDLSDPEMILLHSFLNLPFALIVSLSCSFLDLHRLYFQTGYHQRISPEKEALHFCPLVQVRWSSCQTSVTHALVPGLPPSLPVRVETVSWFSSLWRRTGPCSWPAEP